jgi:hypothetical protein
MVNSGGDRQIPMENIVVRVMDQSGKSGVVNRF